MFEFGFQLRVESGHSGRCKIQDFCTLRDLDMSLWYFDASVTVAGSVYCLSDLKGKPRVFEFEQWKRRMGEKAAALQEVGQLAELRSGAQLSPKSNCEFRLQTKRALGSFTLWVTGEADFDVMDSQSKEFAHHVWGMIVDDLSFEGAFDDFLTRVLNHPTPGGDVTVSMRSAWFRSESKL